MKDSPRIARPAWLRHQSDFRNAVSDIIACGGDADSTAAVVGGIIGAAVGQEGIPEEWVRNLWGWPLTTSWLRKLATATNDVANGRGACPQLPFVRLLARNLVVLPVVLAHGFRRLAPPY